jgi:cytochrome c-type biogenesis protein CcmF
MEPGRVSVLVGLTASTISLVLYVVALRRGAHLARVARWVYAVAAAASVFCFAWLMHLVASKRFEYRYVFDYTSVDLHGAFLYSATWAGQEGSFALWAAFTGVIGLYVAWRARDWEARVMPVYLTTMIALFAIMQWLSPFVIMPPETGPRPADLPPNMPWPPPWPPQDGNGLNPSLQNIWMAIHPPVIFVGFASLAVPFAYAMATLMFRTYGDWAKRVAPYVLFTVATLGVGLFLGGYWAYETQGWHGFWAWDPVENASLFPWLGSLALAHGLVMQRSRGTMTRTNLFLAIASWLLFVYGTFLTRSGVLANFSVHAFGMLDNAALKILIALIAVQGLTGLVLLVLRWRGIPGREVTGASLSLDTATWFAILLLCIGAAAVCLGTSWPLISRWPFWRSIPGLAGLHAPGGVRVEPVFYNRIGTALTIPTLIILGITPFLIWGRTEAEQVLRRVLVPWLVSIVGGGFILWFVLHEASTGFEAGVPRVVTVAIGTLSIFAAVTNGALAVKLLRMRRISAGSWLAHAGVGLLLLGCVITNVYEKTASYAVIEGRGPVSTAFGYSIEFVGWTHEGKPEDQVLKDWQRFDHAVRLRVKPDRAGEGGGYEARVAVFKYWNAGQGEWATMTWPDIRKQWHRDIYLAAADDPKLVRPIATLRPGEASTIGVPGLGPTGYQVRYDRFYRTSPPGQMTGEMGAEMTLITPEGHKIKIRPGLRFEGAETRAVHVAIPELGGAAILQDGIDPESKQVTAAFELPGAPASWVVPIAATNKPMINLVWLGVALIGAGALVAMVRRASDVRRSLEADAG